MFQSSVDRIKTYLGSASILVVFYILTWFAGSALGLHGSDLWIFRVGVAVLGTLIAAGVLVLMYARELKQSESGGVQSGPTTTYESDGLLRRADEGLWTGRRTRIRNLPVFFILGSSNSAKTTAVVRSGIQTELIAGHVFEGSEVIPTKSVNCWLGSATVIVEAAAEAQSNPTQWAGILRYLRPSSGAAALHAGRAVLLCYSAEGLLSASAEDLVVEARNIRTRLEEIAQTLGIRVPTYVLFTKSDCIPFFREYCSELSSSQVEQALGVTLPLQSDSSMALYTQAAFETINQEFEGLVTGLANQRPDLLQRQREVRTESDKKRLAAIYEFPREFGKIQQNAVSFLVELCKPSQLRSGPFLRGFYFCGVRPTAGPNSRGPVVARAARPAMNATHVFRPGQENVLAINPVGAEPAGLALEWIFLHPVFEQILLKDRIAMNASRPVPKLSRRQTLGLGIVAALAVIVLVGMIVSFFANLSLISDVTDVLRTGDPSDVVQLDKLRTSLSEIAGYDPRVPWRLRWGLYSGGEVYRQARGIYFDRFERILLQSVKHDLISMPSGVALNQVNGFQPTFEALKAYLMMTSNRDRFDSGFLSPYLLRRWSESHASTSEQQELVKNQFDFVTGQMKADRSALAAEPDRDAVAALRRYLRSFEGSERVYTAMVDDASKAGKPIQFNQRFQGSADIVTDTYSVASAFTKDGWKFMQEAFRNPARYISSEQWVLGEDSTTGMDQAALAKLRSKYVSEFISRWRQFLKSAQVVKFQAAADGAPKLRSLAGGNLSPLLGLFATVSDNMPVDSPEVQRAFQSVLFVIPAGSADKWTNPANTAYMAALSQLQVDFEQIAGAPPGTQVDPQILQQAKNSVRSAKIAAQQIAQNFVKDDEGHLEKTVKDLLDAPVTLADTALASSSVRPPAP